MTTYVVTKNIIRRIFEDIATAHKQIKSFGYGDELDYIQKLMNEDTQELAANVLYPRLFVSPTDSVISPGSYARSYVIMVADRIRTGDNNFTEVESDTDLILLDVIAQIQDSDYGFVLDIDNIAVTPFKNKFADMVTGHMATISLVSDWEFDRCQIPQSFIAVTNPYVPFENGSNERDPLSWHLAGNNLDYEGFLGTTSAQGYSLGTNSIRRWNLELEGHLVPNASGVYDIGSASSPVRTLYVDSIQGNFKNGITSLNGLTDSVQTFAVGTSGTDFNISSSGGVHTFNIPSASTTNRGVVTTSAQTFAGDKAINGHLLVNDSGLALANSISFRAITDGNAAGTLAYAFQAPFSGVAEDIFTQNQRGDAVIFRCPSNAVGMDLSLRTNRTLNIGTDLVQFSARNASGTFYGGLRFSVGASATNDTTVEFRNLSGGVVTTQFRIDGNRIGFFTATPIAKPTVAGSWGGIAAGKNLSTALANLGLITDNTTL